MAIDLTDRTGNGNTLTNVSASEYTSSLPFSDSTIAVDLSGSTQYLNATNSASLSITGTFSVECWVNVDNFPTSGNFMNILTNGFASGTGKGSILLRLYNNGGSLELWGGIYDAGDITTKWTITGWNTGEWHHLAVVYNGSTIKLYFDTVEKHSISNSTNPTDVNLDFCIGCLNYDATYIQFFDGKIDDVRVWNDDRSAAELAANYNVQLIGTESNLVAYWPFNPVGSGGGILLFM